MPVTAAHQEHHDRYIYNGRDIFGALAAVVGWSLIRIGFHFVNGLSELKCADTLGKLGNLPPIGEFHRRVRIGGPAGQQHDKTDQIAI